MITLLGKEYLTEKEAATMFGHSIGWLRMLRYRKKCSPYIRLSEEGKIYYQKTALEDWIRKKILENQE